MRPTVPQNIGPPELKWAALVGFAAATPKPPMLKDQTSPLASVATTFLRNIQRINWMILTPSLVGDLTIDIQRAFDVAAAANISPQTWEQFVIASLERGTQPVEMISGADAPARQGLEAILSSCVTGIWTAFETMAGDLWEAALNTHPQGLAELKGKRRRLLKGGDEAPSSDDDTLDDKDGIRSVPLPELIRHEFKIEKRMGSVLKTRRRFDHLPGIREAYALAFFKKSDAIDDLLKYDGLDALNAVRNLLVHRAGVVDYAYERKAKYLAIPQAPVGSTIFLDGEIIKDMITSIIILSMKLVVEVDAWIDEN